MTTILFHASNNPANERRLQDALAVARALDGHVSCLHFTPAEAFIAFDTFGGVFVSGEILDAVLQSEREIRERTEALLKHEDVSWDYQQAGGGFAPGIAGFGALADLIVTGRLSHRGEAMGDPVGLLGDLLTASRTPLLICGDADRVHDPFGPAVIGWNGKPEAAAAVRGALPLLKLASSVEVVTIREEGRRGDLFPSTRLLEYLSRHGVHADLRQVEPNGDGVVPTMLGAVRSAGASTLVTGGFGRSRLGEYLFGGVTRSLLEACPVAWVVAH